MPTNESIKEMHDADIWHEALKCLTREDFKLKATDIYKEAECRGILDDVCCHMDIRDELLFRPKRKSRRQKRISKAAFDSLYILKSDREHKSKPVYKVGVTSCHRGDDRIHHVKRASGFECKKIFHKRVNVDARIAEKEILAIGDQPFYDVFDGCTEYRAWDDSELSDALAIAENHSES